MKRIIVFLATLAFTCTGLDAQRLTVKEFLRLSPSDTSAYVVSGVVSKVRSSTSGSFYLQDETGTLLVYGLQSPGLDKSFKEMDIVKGDTLTVRGRFTIYDGTTREMKNGILLSKANGPNHNLSFMDRLEKKPVFKGKEGYEAEEAFRQWVQAHLIQPADGSKGTVTVRFVVGRKGAVQEIQVLKSPSPAQSDAAVKTLQKAPTWKPARADGAPVRVVFTIPVVFE